MRTNSASSSRPSNCERATHEPWADIPERYGPYTTCYNRFVRWTKIGVWDRIFDAVSKAYDGKVQMIDSSSIRVHQHGANGKKRQKGAEQNGAEAAAGDRTDSRCMGRSRGGLTTKVHALVDANGLPIALKLTPGQAHDGKSASDMLSALSKGQTLLADAAYDSDALRENLRKRGVKGEIKPIPGRLVALKFNKRLYKKRNAVERFFNKMKHYRAIATRYESTPKTISRSSNSPPSEFGYALMSR